MECGIPYYEHNLQRISVIFAVPLKFIFRAGSQLAILPSERKEFNSWTEWVANKK